MKWYIVESRSGADAVTLRASSPDAALRAAKQLAPDAALRAAKQLAPDAALIKVREADASEIPAMTGARA